VRFMLVAMFFAAILGLLWQDFGRRERAAIAVLGFAMTTLYYVFAARLM
jgi:hypothetical protein